MNSTRSGSTHGLQNGHCIADPRRSSDAERGVAQRWPRVIGILGGLGPHAHIELERCLLSSVGQPLHEQDYPEWFVASLSATPDRTLALLGEGPSPVPALVDGLRRLAPLVDFAVVACHTAHAFLDEVLGQVDLPVLSLVAEVIMTLDRSWRPASRVAGPPGRQAIVGLLATTGTLHAKLYPTAALDSGRALEFISLLDLPNGQRLQEDLVMRPVYGRATATARAGGGIKSGTLADPESHRPHAESLAEAAARLVAAGAICIVPACTEVSLALHGGTIEGVPVLDPLQILAAAALEVASGRRPLPVHTARGQSASTCPACATKQPRSRGKRATCFHGTAGQRQA